jgi:uncharacterized protein YggU (UPF0235/DUF167 family)
MLLRIKVITDAKEDRVEPIKENSFAVYTKEPAEQNRANKRMIALISKYLQKPTGKIRILTGHHQPSKIIEVID